jgi:hypothetical protein
MPTLLFLSKHFPNPIHEIQRHTRLPSHWTISCHTICNCDHGGSIETDHFAIIVTTTQLSQDISLSSDTQTPIPMSSIINQNTLSTINITTGDLILTNPAPAYRARSETPLQAITTKLIK